MAKTKTRSRGRLPKAQQLEKNLLEMEEELKEELLKGNQLITKNYNEYLKTLDEAARGLGNVSETNKISCAKVLAKKAEDYFKEVEKSEKVSSEEETPEENSTGEQKFSLISTDFGKAVGD